MSRNTQQPAGEDSVLVRINKVLADAGVCSRRKADELILSGQVAVNEATVTELGLRIDPNSDTVRVQGKLIVLKPDKQKRFLYLMLNKPVQVVSTVTDPQKRTTVIQCLPPALRNQRVYPVGRLDYFSEGLLLLTNDGELTNRLTHPRYHQPKVYEVTVREKPDASSLRMMRDGMTLSEGQKLAPVEVKILSSRSNATVLQMTLHQGVNRQIRRMCRDLGLTVLSLKRIALGPLSLGTLPQGQVRHLDTNEIQALKTSTGL